MQTKHEAGRTALIQVSVEAVLVNSKDETHYCIRIPALNPTTVWVDETVLEDGDFIPIEVYEREINALKDEINCLRGNHKEDINGMDDKRLDAGAEETAGTGVQEDGRTV